MKRPVPSGLFLLSLLLAAQPCSARVVRVEVRARSDVLGGKVFGLAGAYEKVSGTMFFAVRPEDPRDRAIVDLALAPRNAKGEVEFSADVYVIRPKDPARASGTLLLEVSNRGGKGILALMNRGRGSTDPAAAEEFGDGFLMRRAATVAWVGWQWDVREFPGRLRLEAFPALVPKVDADGNDVAGVRIAEMTVPVATYTGWNLRDPKTGLAGEFVSFIGSYVPFAKTRADREKTSDPRPSLEERYGSRERYLGLFTDAALRQVKERFLLPEDLPDVLLRGASEWDSAAK